MSNQYSRLSLSIGDIRILIKGYTKNVDIVVVLVVVVSSIDC